MGKSTPNLLHKVIWRSRTYRWKTNSCIATIDISKSICAQFQISSFTPSYRKRKLIEDPTSWGLLSLPLISGNRWSWQNWKLAASKHWIWMNYFLRDNQRFGGRNLCRFDIPSSLTRFWHIDNPPSHSPLLLQPLPAEHFQYKPTWFRLVPKAREADTHIPDVHIMTSPVNVSRKQNLKHTDVPITTCPINDGEKIHSPIF